MKRVLVFCLVLLMLIPLCACGEKSTSLRREKMTAEEALWQPSENETVVLRTSAGTLRGIRRDGWLEFRGVPYATAERWEQAVPVTAWEGIRDATRWGDRCAQHKGFYGTADTVVSQFYEDEALIEFPAKYSEDGLNLNIWTPERAENCPVLVYIHGGSFVKGSNSDPAIDGEAYAKRGIILISVNYRLGPFATPYGDGYTGNLALTDQLTALRWIRDNIGDYGGDPKLITVMGESAGAISVQNLLISPLVEDGLIAGAVMLSGGGSMTAIGSPVMPVIPANVWRKVKESVGAEELSQLKELSAPELFEAWSAQLGVVKELAPQPVSDGVVLNNTVAAALAQDRVKNVPVIIGILENDIVPHDLYTSAVEYGRQRAEKGGKPVYLYYFDRVPPGNPAFGAFHGADLYYVFGTLYRNRREFTDADYRLAESMITYICNFVRSGDPNGEDLPLWEPATAESQRFLRFGEKKPEMMEPDEEILLHSQKTRPMFPFAAGIRPADGKSAK